MRVASRPTNPATRNPQDTIIMAKLTDFRVNARKLREGDWIDMGEDWDGMKLKVRAQGRAYFDARARAMARAAKDHGGDEARIPDAVVDRITAEAAGEHLLIDVAELSGANGEPVTVEDYRALMLDPDYAPLGAAVLVASDRLARRARAEAREAEGFSQPPSAGG